MPEGSITDADQQFVETWENITQSWNTILHIDRRGDITEEVIRVPKKFMVTTEERLLLEDRIIDPKHNPFRNGDFRPVIVPDSVTVETNPNALSEDEMISIFVSSPLAFDEWMAAIDSPATLQRMLDAADRTDKDVPLRRYNAVKARLAEVKPKTQVVQKDRDEFEKISNPATPSRSSAARRRSDATNT